MAQLGYNHKNSGESFYIKYPIKGYHNLISMITKQEAIKRPLILKFDKTKSIYSSKYSLKLQNLFYYRIQPASSDEVLQDLNLNLRISQKSRLIKMVNFDVLPIINLDIQNISNKFPFTLGIKLGKFSASRIQHFDQTNKETYDFSKVLKSMLPYYRTGIRLGHSSEAQFNIYGKKIELITKYIFAVNRIHNYEDNMKLTANFKTYFDFYEEFKKYFRIRVSNDLTIKKAFIKDIKKTKFHKHQEFTNNENTSKMYSEHHVLSGYECYSRLLEMNLLNSDNVIENGTDFLIQNVLTLRLKDIPYFKNHEILSRINPYFSFESIFLPSYRTDSSGRNKIKYIEYKDSLRYVYTLGLSIALNEYAHIDIALHTDTSKNSKIKKELFNNFRINLTI